MLVGGSRGGYGAGVDWVDWVDLMPNLNLMNHAWFVHHDSFWNMAPTCWTISPNHVLSHMEDLLSLSNLLQPHPIFSCARREKSPFELEDEALGSGLQQFYLFIILINCQELLRRVQSPEQAIPMSIFFRADLRQFSDMFPFPKIFWDTQDTNGHQKISTRMTSCLLIPGWESEKISA